MAVCATLSQEILDALVKRTLHLGAEEGKRYRGEKLSQCELEAASREHGRGPHDSGE